MDINEIKRRFDLLKKVNNESYCLVSELAKELKVSKTDLMQFIEDNHDLFSLGVITDPISNRVAKNKGLLIKNVYLTSAENPTTDEWIEKKVKENKKYIYINEIEYYGRIEGYYISRDSEKGSHNREYLWRNTKEKLDKLVEQGIVCKHTFCIGNMSDCYSSTFEYALLGDWENKLIENGWKFNVVRK